MEAYLLMAWVKTNPVGTAALNVGDNAIRDNNEALETGLNREHVLITGGAQTLFHKFTNSNKAAMDALIGMVDGTIAIRNGTDDAVNPGIFAYNGSTWDQVATLIPATTAMVFHQAAAPAGWTADETLNDNMLIVTTAAATDGGTAHSTGTWTISAIITSQVTDGTAITVAQMPSHDHDIPGSGNPNPWTTTPLGGATSGDVTYTTATEGSGDTHNHGLTFIDTWRPASRLVIVCTKKAVTA